jgi:hypothetical protein
MTIMEKTSKLKMIMLKEKILRRLGSSIVRLLTLTKHVKSTQLRDYAAVPELDRYDEEDLASDKDVDEMSYAERRRVTDMLNQRDRERMTSREARIGDSLYIAFDLIQNL